MSGSTSSWLKAGVQKHPWATGVTSGAGLGVSTNVMSQHWAGAPFWFVAAVFYASMIALFVPLPSIMIWTNPWSKTNFARLVLIACYLTLIFVPIGWADKKWSKILQADLEMCLDNKQRPELLAVNMSDEITAENIQYEAVLFDVDSPTPDTPIQIFNQVALTIRPLAAATAPLFTDNLISPLLVKNGDRIFGTIGITCAKCSTGRMYWMFVKWGEGGWYQLDKDSSSGAPMTPHQSHPAGAPDQSIARYMQNLVEGRPYPGRVQIHDISEAIPDETPVRFHPYAISDCIKNIKGEY